eukprot:scaffold75419_cov24-Tisochrysis_lutea.AAC.2
MGNPGHGGLRATIPDQVQRPRCLRAKRSEISDGRQIPNTNIQRQGKRAPPGIVQIARKRIQGRVRAPCGT